MKSALISSCLIVICLFFSACDDLGGKKLIGIEPEQLSGVKNGEQKIYSEDGKLQSIVEVKDGKADGRVRKYYENGKLRMDAIYKAGRKNGKCIYYYENGKAFSQSNYVDGYKEGEEKRYYEEGQLFAVVNFKHNEVQPGLKEYRKDGKEIDHKVGLVIEEKDYLTINGTYIVKVSLTNNKYKPVFSVLFPSEKNAMMLLKNSGNAGVYEVPVVRGSFYMKKLIFQAKMKTTLGNDLIIQKPYNLAIDA